jgi:hypothetical protein
LVAQRFAAAGRHQHQRILPGYQLLNDFLLLASEFIVAENGFEDFDGFVIHNDLFDRPK